MLLSLWDWVSYIDRNWPRKLEFSDIREMVANKCQYFLELTPDVKINDDNVHTIQIHITSFWRRVTGRATATPKKDTLSPTRKSNTWMGRTTTSRLTSSWAPETMITWGYLGGIILVTPTTLINYTLDVSVVSTTLALSSSSPMRPWGDSVVLSWGNSLWGTIRSAVSPTILSPTVLVVSGDAQWPRFIPFQINCSGRARQRPFFGQNDTSDLSPLLLVHPNSRRPNPAANSSPAHCFVGGTSPGNDYQKAREDCIDHFITGMEHDRLVYIAEKLNKHWVIRAFTK